MANDNAPDPMPRARKRLTGSDEPLPVAPPAQLHPLIADPQAARNIPGTHARTQPNKPLAARRAKGNSKVRVTHPPRRYSPTAFSIPNLAYATGLSTRRLPLRNEAEAGPSRFHNATRAEGGPSHRVNAIHTGNNLQSTNVATKETSKFVGLSTVGTVTPNPGFAVVDNQLLQLPHEILTNFAGLKPGTRIKLDLHAGLQRMGGLTLAIESVENENQERQARATVAAPASVGQPLQRWKLLVQNEAHA
ncbi:hypothetical protein HBI56_049420 [Parastagonospora nodorum]|nr:hypothetical protein HBH52_115380 [Parastagonospora nodorum]KAH4073992.1 hypothetical protein HBH50_040890 [Parastagonospora nodorum]KAH4091505.1 hypothetical protein HBH48_093210 [Parastagonospora nodorum]KAH4121453.1 hypothetical protein HBH47_103300 [Parastagonospora nodorum]KAH4178746.1 hypothetical protein HBH43_028170 [Parastagonospora nodorum]